MEALTALKQRRSVREFKREKIPREVIEQIIDAARFAPTARNIQPWEFIAITRPETLAKIAAVVADNGKFIANAGACFGVVCQDTKYFLEDGSSATYAILLAACALGIGTCWVAGDKKPYSSEICSMLGVPDGYKLISLIAAGYPAGKAAFTVAQKRPVQELLHWEKF